MGIELSVIWFVIIVFATLMYIVMDGFDLGIGLLFSTVRGGGDRDVMVNSVAPVWDGNETWLVLGGAGLFGAFPLAYAVIIDALSIPLTLMLIGLIFRGVAFEFRFQATPSHRPFWDRAFFGGSLLATFSQGSLILTHSLDKQVPALKEFAPEERPNSTVVFWSFRLMAGLGMLMLLLGVLALWLRRGDRLYHSRPFLRFALWMGPSGLIAILAGWVTTEVGRQPWVVYGVQRTADAVSAHGDLHMSVSLLTFIVVYSAVFGVGYSYMLRLIRKGPQEMLPATTGTPARPLSAATEGYLQKESR